MPFSTRFIGLPFAQEGGKRREGEQRVLLADRAAHTPQDRYGSSSAVRLCNALREVQRTAQLRRALRPHEERDTWNTHNVRGCRAVVSERSSEATPRRPRRCGEAGCVQKKSRGLSEDLCGAVAGSGHENSAAPS